MKRILTTLCAALLAAVTLFAQNDNGHMLTDLWKKYDKARKADLPQQEASILKQIKEEAAARRLPVDFYDAATQYVESVRRRNWKEYDPARKALEAEVKAFDEPVVTFLWMASWESASVGQLWNYYKENEARLTGCHKALHRGVESILNGSLTPFIRSDREWALWLMAYKRFSTENEVFDALADEVKGVYPNEPVFAFYKLLQKSWLEAEWEQEKAAFDALARQYEGKAVSVYPRAEVLRLRYSRLEREKAGSEAFKALYNDAKALEKERSAYSGSDKTLVKGCNYPANLMETLTGKSLDVSFSGRKAIVALQNLSSADVTLRGGKKTVKTWKVKNPVNSFYVLDTVKLDLPVLPDGDYTLEAKNGKISAQDHYTQYTLSLALRRDGRGRCVYVADYETGVPLRTVTLHLRKNGTEVAASTLKLDGFTPLPQALASHLENKKSSWELVAGSGDRLSQPLYVGSYYEPTRHDDYERCNIYKDRGAYNPGDTLQFKAIVYKGDPRKGLEAVKGRKVEMRLHDSEDNILEKQTFMTNEWGSVAGSFVLPTGLRNGRFELEAVGLGADWFRVDEFILPTFDVRFNLRDKLCLVGSEVPVGGRIESYSGHPLSGAKLQLKVKCYDSVVFDEEVSIGVDNTFSAVFKAVSSGYYNVEATIVEATGETHSFSDGFYVGDDISLRAQVESAADAELIAAAEPDSWRWRNNSPKFTVTDTRVRVRMTLLSSGNEVSAKSGYTYRLVDASDKEIASGSALTGDALELNLPGDGFFRLFTRAEAVKADGASVAGECIVRLFCIRPASKALCKDVRRVFLPGPLSVASGSAIKARLGSAEGDAWAVVTLYGEDLKVLENKALHIADGTLENLSFIYKDSYPDAVRLSIFYFLHGNSVHWDREYRREKDKYSLPLSFTRFTDKAYPGTEYSFSVKTAAGAEALAAAWDKSLDAVAYNYWPLVSTRDFSVDMMDVSSVCGRVGGPPVYRMAMGGRALAKASGSVNMAVMDDMVAVEESAEAIPFQLEEQKPTFGSWEELKVREVFASALTFQPQLYPEADGTLTVKFRTSDKLSTYYVRVYAHDRAMHNASVEKELVVSLPVKVALLEPRYLYAGDRYEAVVTVSSVSDESVSGVLALRLGDLVQEVPVTVPAGATVSHGFMVSVPSAEEASVTMTAAFKGKDFSDAVRVKVPLRPAAQQLTEAHSAVLLAGMDREALLKQLRSRFVNVPASAAALREITVLDMVREAIPSHVEPSGNDVLSLSEAWYVRLMASRLQASPAEAQDDLLDKILACRNADGGFGWFEGMSSSPVITAVLLERFALLKDRGFAGVPDVTSAVKFLDKRMFDDERPFYCGYLSDEQYLHVRALYAGVPFEVKPVSAQEKKRMKAFTKEAKAYLIPAKKDGRGLNGQILRKARRLLTLRSLLERDGGLALAKAWGIGLGASGKLQASIKADVASLLEYAVAHRDGGWYYPNAVMPWRGLLESEAYAHALLCQLLAAYPSGAGIADGIRLWLMLQKETQKWDAEPAFIDAITAILDGSEAVLNTRVVILEASYEAPIRSIKASGNGFTIGRKFFRDGQEIHPGDLVHVGDKIEARYEIWNAENRSFVKLTAPREAALTPVRQLSGYMGFGLIVPRIGAIRWHFRPQGYRNVKASATEYYFDTYPEESTTVTEEFFVERAGVFQAPVVEIESLYAPHYRANEGWRGTLDAAR